MKIDITRCSMSNSGEQTHRSAKPRKKRLAPKRAIQTVESKSSKPASSFWACRLACEQGRINSMRKYLQSLCFTTPIRLRTGDKKYLMKSPPSFSAADVTDESNGSESKNISISFILPMYGDQGGDPTEVLRFRSGPLRLRKNLRGLNSQLWKFSSESSYVITCPLLVGQDMWSASLNVLFAYSFSWSFTDDAEPVRDDIDQRSHRMVSELWLWMNFK